jgi:hypothetical protein
MAKPDFKGARGSNTGDSFHELWALRESLRLLDVQSPLTALTVEGVLEEESGDGHADQWEGVDCGLYYGGDTVETAARIELVQLKYSGANPGSPWTIANLTKSSGKNTNNSVIRRLAAAFDSALKRRPSHNVKTLTVRLATNRPVASAVLDAIEFGKKGAPPSQRKKLHTHTTANLDSAKLQKASGLDASTFQSFCHALSMEGGSSSRFALQEQLIRSISSWIGDDARTQINNLLQFVRNRMMPEEAGRPINRESMLALFGLSELKALFPCPPNIKKIEHPIRREQSQKVCDALRNGQQYVCLHGEGGCGKTTLVQEIGPLLPRQSLMVVFDCYGAGTYLNSDSYRHRSKDAFLELSNDLAAQLAVPLVLTRSEIADYPRLFKDRLTRAGDAIHSADANALLVIVVDAADNAVIAAESCVPQEPSFVPDFARLGSLPQNVRLVVTCRTGRMNALNLPSSFLPIRIDGFSEAETARHVATYWPNAPADWIADFHELSRHNPRVQAYALVESAKNNSPKDAIDYLRPNGKGLDDVFRSQLEYAVQKGGNQGSIERFCAALSVMARPIPLIDLASVSQLSIAQLRDISSDLAPGIRIESEELTLADEDFEHFIQRAAGTGLAAAKAELASWLWGRRSTDTYAATHIGAALLESDRGKDLIAIIDQETEPAVIKDPVLRREVQLRRLRQAMAVCRDSGNTVDAVRMLIRGTEAITTDEIIRARLIQNPDLSAVCSPDSASAMILRDSSQFSHHGTLLFHLIKEDARAGKRVLARERIRQLDSWLDRRREAMAEDNKHGRSAGDDWPISTREIAAQIEATLHLYGPDVALKRLRTWTPRALAPDALELVAQNLILTGRQDSLNALLNSGAARAAWKLFLSVPAALAGKDVSLEQLKRGIREIGKPRFIDLAQLKNSWDYRRKMNAQDAILAACEIAVNRGAEVQDVAPALNCFTNEEYRRVDGLYLSNPQLLDVMLRACSLLARSKNESLTLDKFWIVPKPDQPSDKSNVHPKKDERVEKLQIFLESLVKAYDLRAQIILGQISGKDIGTALGEIAGSASLKDYRVDRSFEVPQIRAQVAHTMALLVGIRGVNHDRLLSAVSSILGERLNPLPDDCLDALSAFRMIPNLHSRLLQIVVNANNYLGDLRMTASDRIDAKVRFARFVLPMSSEAAGAFFLSGLECAAGIDREVLLQIRVMNSLARQACPDLARMGRLEIGRNLMAVTADAALRLDDTDGMPWDDVAVCLAQLDLPLALAAVARWEDMGVVGRESLLPMVIQDGLNRGTLSAAQAVALLPLVNHADMELIRSIANSSKTTASEQQAKVVDFVAYDELLRYGRGSREEVCSLLGEMCERKPQWLSKLCQATTLLRKLKELPEKQERNGDTSRVPQNSDNKWAAGLAFDSADHIEAALKAAREEAKKYTEYPGSTEAFDLLIPHVPLNRRCAFLSGLAEMLGSNNYYFSAEHLHKAIELWRSDPGVQQWCREELPATVQDRLIRLGAWARYGQSPLTNLIADTQLPNSEVCNLFVAGLAQNADDLSADVALPLVSLIATHLTAPQAHSLASWYSERVSSRIPTKEKDVVDISDMPDSVQLAIGRFLFAVMSDVDVRIRWLAAHSVRRLAKLSQEDVMRSLVSQYGRFEERIYRQSDAPFYWLAARLWLLIAIDRISGELPLAVVPFSNDLLKVALDDALPHLLIRAFAKSSLDRLVKSRNVSLDSQQLKALAAVNVSQFRRKVAKKGQRDRKVAHKKAERKRQYSFDHLDTVPYWYEPALRGFSGVSMEQFLDVAEHWIMDRWKVSTNVSRWKDEKRQNRFPERSWHLWSNDHGSNPTLERPFLYYEWHAMWCTLGELLSKYPLAAEDNFEWNDFYHHLNRNMLTAPPHWLADYRMPKPLEARFWSKSEKDVDTWIANPDETEFQTELGIVDGNRKGVIVNGYHETEARWFRSSVSIESALVEPCVAGALLRALQTANHYADYRIPPEEHELEIDENPYRLIGWIKEKESHDRAIDDIDPLRNEIGYIAIEPGKSAFEILGLKNQNQDGLWCDAAGNTVFSYEAWSDRRNRSDNEPFYDDSIGSNGHRLWVNKKSLRRLLEQLGMDLVVEVRNDRSNRGYGYGNYGSKDEIKQTYDRLYCLKADGTVETASGNIGTW